MSPRKTPLSIDPVPPHMCSTGLRLEILGGVPFFSSLTAPELEQVNALFKERGFEAGETVYFEGDPAERLYVVADGTVKLLRHTAGGRDVLLDLLVRGEYSGSLAAQDGEMYQETAQAHTPACLLTISRPEFRKILAHHPEVALSILDLTSARLAASQETVLSLSAYTAEQRIAHTLLTLAKKLGEHSKEGLLIQTPLSRDDLAHLTGSTPETASRIMSQFQKYGLISSGRQWVALLQPEKLEEILNEM